MKCADCGLMSAKITSKDATCITGIMVSCQCEVCKFEWQTVVSESEADEAIPEKTLNDVLDIIGD